MKVCPKCSQELQEEEFYVHKRMKDGLSNWCRKCISINKKRIVVEKSQGIYVSKVRKPRLTEEDRKQRKEEAKEYNAQYRIQNKQSIAQGKKEYNYSLKRDGINAYGGKCTCCGESIVEFLTIEHLNGRDPNEKRFTGSKMWMKAKAEGYPDTYTVLCFNCNCAKGAFGICPHQQTHSRS